MYPTPFRRSNSSSSFFYFKYTDPITRKRSLKSTGTTKKGEALKFIKDFMDDLNGNFSCSPMVLKDYLQPWLTPETNPRYNRYLLEKKQYGYRHASDLGKLLEKHVTPDTIFRMTISQITRGHALDFRMRILERGLNKHLRVANKVIAAIKSVFSEGIYRGEQSIHRYW